MHRHRPCSASRQAPHRALGMDKRPGQDTLEGLVGLHPPAHRRLLTGVRLDVRAAT
jgi:hypothetical protein